MDEYFKFVNAKLDESWKVTSTACETEGCRVRDFKNQGTLLANLDKKKTICTKCKIELDAEFLLKQAPPAYSVP